MQHSLVKPEGRTVRLACPNLKVQHDRRDALSYRVHGPSAGQGVKLCAARKMPSRID